MMQAANGQALGSVSKPAAGDSSTPVHSAFACTVSASGFMSGEEGLEWIQ